jgi:hypothetical protein
MRPADGSPPLPTEEAIMAKPSVSRRKAAKRSAPPRTAETQEKPKSIHEQLDDAFHDLFRGITLLKVLHRSMELDDDADLETAWGFGIREIEQAHDRLDCALVRLSNEGVRSEYTKKDLARSESDAKASRLREIQRLQAIDTPAQAEIGAGGRS